ncbi:MAG: hypothetical protein ABWY33_10010 [Cellulomonas sp.]
MSHPTLTPAPTVSTSWRRTAGRWMVSFLGFPLGGYASFLLVGPVDGLVAALIGGLLTGAVLGAVQVWGFGATRPPALRWVVATALGLMVGLGVGAAAVGFATTLTALVVQGALSGLAVGVAQAVVLASRLGRTALAWPVWLGAVWATGWAVTSAFGIQVDDQFTVFGSSGALVVAALTAVLPVALKRTATSAS